MHGQEPTMGGQPRCCGGNWLVRQIQIGEAPVGLVGLDDALRQLFSSGRLPGPEVSEVLLAAMRARNYVARGDEDNYRAALLREYTAYWEKKSGAGQGEERGR
jgi:hypothetical protein